jgi:hypothetical protein
MKRLTAALAIALSFACGREAPPAKPAPPPSTAAPQPTVTFPTAAPKMRSTPQKCDGDGSYAAALDCFRMTSGFTFDVKDSDVTGEGAMNRPSPGGERLVIKTKRAGTWSAETKATGVVWTHDGKRDTNEPAWADRIWQRTTMFLDPQKKEGTPQLAGSDGETNHYHFTDANSSVPYDVYVSKRDGAITKMRMGTFEMSIR